MSSRRPGAGSRDDEHHRGGPAATARGPARPTCRRLAAL